MAETLKLTPSESLTIVASTPERLVVEATYGPGGQPPPKHHHPSQDENFTILSGRLRFRVGPDDRALEEGEEIEIPAGAVHQVWNPHAQPATVNWVTSPAGRTEAWFRAVDALNREAGEGRSPGLVAFAPLLREYRDTFRLDVGPDLIVAPLVAGLGALGRLRRART